MTDRRDFLRLLGGGAVLASPLGALACKTAPRQRVAGAADARLGAGARDPRPHRSAEVPRSRRSTSRATARAPAELDCTAAIRAAIAACSAAGGGRVVVPAGRFLTGAVHLASNVNLHVTSRRDAGVQSGSRALPARGAHALRGHGADELLAVHLRVRAREHRHHRRGNARRPGRATRTGGRGREAPTSDGRRERRTTTRRGSDCSRWPSEGAPVARRRFGEGDYLRPNFIQPYRCRNVLIEGRHDREFADVGDSSGALSRTSRCAA